MKVEIELPEIEGYEYTGEYRCPKKGEYFLGCASLTACSIEYEGSMNVGTHILKKVKPSLIGMLCEVWDDDDVGSHKAIIEEINSGRTCPYMDGSGVGWVNAKPVSVAALLDCLDLAREYEKH